MSVVECPNCKEHVLINQRTIARLRASIIMAEEAWVKCTKCKRKIHVMIIPKN